MRGEAKSGCMLHKFQLTVPWKPWRYALSWLQTHLGQSKYLCSLYSSICRSPSHHLSRLLGLVPNHFRLGTRLVLREFVVEVKGQMLAYLRSMCAHALKSTDAARRLTLTGAHLLLWRVLTPPPSSAYHSSTTQT